MESEEVRFQTAVEGRERVCSSGRDGNSGVAEGPAGPQQKGAQFANVFSFFRSIFGRPFFSDFAAILTRFRRAMRGNYL